MKKILFLLLCAATSYGQIVPTGQETAFDYGIQNTASQLDDNATYITVQTTDGVQGKSNSSTWAKKIYVDNVDVKKAFLSTGLIKNGLVTTNADPTKFNITAGIGIISNFDNPENPTSTIVNFPAFTGITPTYLTSGNITYVGITLSSGTPVVLMKASPFDNVQRRNVITIGAVIHSNLTTINLVNNISAPTNAGTNQLHDLMEAIGSLNVSGNKYSANGANLSLNKSAGDIFKLGVNFANNWKDPHKLTVASGTALTFRYRTQNGTEGADVTALNPALYDLNNVLTNVPSNRFSIQTVTLFQTGQTRMQYGQSTYATMAEAEAAIITRAYNVESNIAANGITRAYIILRHNATSLQDANDAKIIEAQKFGGVASGGVALTDSAIIAALGYTPANDLGVLHKTGDETKAGKLNLSNTNLYSVENPVFSGLTDTGITGNLNGLYYYSVNYYNSLGETETSGDGVISVVNKQVSITLPISTNPTVIGRRLYRTIANPADQVIKNLVVDIPNNTTTSYVDNVLDGALGASVPRMNTTGGQFFDNTYRIGFASNGSTSFGQSSFLQNTGYADTAFGYGVLSDNTTGYRNVGVGTYALYKNTTGFNNTAIGVHALNYNIGGRNNTAIGFGTLMNNVNGNSNISIGEGSLGANLSGGNNVGVGEAALQSNLASNNVAIGFNSAQYTTTGSGNLSLGTESLLRNTDGNFNTSLGQSSLKMSNGWFNTAIGWNAAANATLIGWDNVVIGAQSGLNMGNYGAQNTFIGSQSGISSLGSGSLFLGNQSGYYETGNNKLFIDNAKRTNEADARVKALIYGQFDASTSNQFVTINGALNVTGIATAPTATVGTNTTQIATTAFVANGFATLSTPAFTGQVDFNGGARMNGTNLYFNSGGTGLIDGVTGAYFKTGFPTAGWYSNNRITAPIFKTTGYTVATLPTGTQGDSAYVTDALAPTYMTTVVGGGAVVTPVFYDGVAWKCH